ncbi:undecaprenyl-diphosphate phosphatase [Liquorilactobacillus mali]|uniref:Undecaprenyl-diphosphatase n=1 Tax=Liquorilactobacillus mali KCTC 3596 = DSM 20444 TaxID=1046596 RepID=J0KX08_9LACO|nr:undecaprenyl-diphosphate phosphatase [Liquorilactobacillus mali]EJE97934.1 undecaprenyl pyrophosphate phosphatase [Liquorilactobacillus mali KCTC 3596 = DSM 20444]KRN09837.1 undecaprenyl pyrophosphate phosphatase [Liquorilactobacillus mali KCTC 3596 = DSM 20444]MDC7953754.1 undecaprenyl-diphosphate phosphatase [Liquorilactobacillus mali]MDV7758842.1 undecaprenyl-diphosphate phosphatase [Liquorilactobacillus mali]QFQ75686.1 undecaprenyl-diphosphate phosphatase [Liquorilactobacillus mali]
MFDIIKAIILGIVEGITEFLPISSTGHLVLVDEFIKMEQSKAFVDMFNVVIQLGAIMAVVVIYFTKLNPWASKKSPLEKKQTWTLWKKVIIAVIPSIIIGLPLNDWMDSHLMNWLVVSIALIFYGILFIIIENHNAHTQPKFSDLNTLSYKTAIIIGLFQVLSLIPGTSRSGSTILGGIMVGTSRYVAAEFSFFLAIPTMFGASLLKLYKFFSHGGSLAGLQGVILAVGVIVSFVVAYISIRFLLNYIKNKDFKVFGWYRIVLGIIVIGYFLIFH